jgi:hypothetical protein
METALLSALWVGVWCRAYGALDSFSRFPDPQGLG